jgi:hypothetical protein
MAQTTCHSDSYTGQAGLFERLVEEHIAQKRKEDPKPEELRGSYASRLGRVLGQRGVSTQDLRKQSSNPDRQQQRPQPDYRGDRETDLPSTIVLSGANSSSAM